VGKPMTTQKSDPVGVGIIGCGTISPQYLENLPLYPGLEVVACSYIDI